MIGSKCLEFVNYQDKLYWVYRKISKESIKEGHILDVRDAWHCDIVLKSKNQDSDALIFLVEMPDAEIIENEKTEEKNQVSP